MKTDLKLGDLIEWYYVYNNDVVVENEMLLSTLMNKWIPIGIVSTLLHKDDKTYSWINSKGCFHARVGDMAKLPNISSRPLVFLRARG